MKKNILTVIIGLLGMGVAQAQLNLNVSYQFGIPATTYSGNPGLSSAGANVKIGYLRDDYVVLNLGTGIYSMTMNELMIDGVDRAVEGATLNVIPVTIGGEFYFLGETLDKQRSKIKPFFGIDLGYVLTIQSESNLTAAINRNNFIVAPTFGISYELSDDLHVFGAARNNIILHNNRDMKNSTQPFQLIGLNVGITFKIQ
jgi:outer membrane protein W